MNVAITNGRRIVLGIPQIADTNWLLRNAPVSRPAVFCISHSVPGDARCMELIATFRQSTVLATRGSEFAYCPERLLGRSLSEIYTCFKWLLWRQPGRCQLLATATWDDTSTTAPGGLSV